MSMRGRHGFSLVELAVVLLITGLVLLFSMPMINRYLTGYNVRNAAAILQGEMRLARQRAVSNDVRGWVYCVVGTNTYYTGQQATTGGTVTWKGPIELPNRLRIHSASFGGFPYFYYNPDGRPSPGAGQAAIVSTVPNAPDTIRVYLDLSGSVWQ